VGPFYETVFEICVGLGLLGSSEFMNFLYKGRETVSVRTLKVSYASLHSEPASALGLMTVWSLWGNPGMARCQEMSNLPAGYIPQRKVTSASSSGSLGFIVCEVLYDG
jgi:hypothetical protein